MIFLLYNYYIIYFILLVINMFYNGWYVLLSLSKHILYVQRALYFIAHEKINLNPTIVRE